MIYSFRPSFRLFNRLEAPYFALLLSQDLTTYKTFILTKIWIEGIDI
jgi:hypothetical protein